MLPIALLRLTPLVELVMDAELFTIAAQSQPGHVLLRLTGDLDLVAREPLLREVEQQAGGLPVVVDASEARFIDASILGALFEAAAQIRDCGGRLLVIDAQIPARSIWHVTRFADICQVFRSAQEAHAALGE